MPDTKTRAKTNAPHYRGLAAAGLGTMLLLAQPAGAGGPIAYEVGTADVGLAAAGYGAWAQDAATSLTTDLAFEDTWHGAIGVQHQASQVWRFDLGVGYDSGFQGGGDVSPALPVDSAWRFGIGTKRQESPRSGSGLAVDYAAGGTLQVAEHGTAPVAAGGRGDLVGSFDDTGVLFLAGNLEWRF
jgi:long-subunit fatty acid transport protein